MTDHQRAIASIEKSLDASAALRRHLVTTERTGRKMIAALQRGVPISEAVAAAGGSTSELRRSTTEMLADYEHARHQMRTAFLLPTLAEGKSIGDIARELGISRQLASRLVREARESS